MSSILDAEPAFSAGPSTGIEPPLPGFQSTFRGPLLFAPQDNLNTDEIYPGKSKQAEVMIGSYGPAFATFIVPIRYS